MDIQKLKQDIIIQTNFRGFDLTLHSTWGLFSPEKIDEGTELLINTLEIPATTKALDIGCGYGAIGITIAKQAKQGVVHMVDKDFVAVEYAKKNAEINGVNTIQTYLSNGFSQVQGKDFDLIVSNLPAKVSKELFWILFSDAKEHLKPNGKFYIVFLSGLKEFMKRNMMETFGNYKKLAQNKTYTVTVARKT